MSLHQILNAAQREANRRSLNVFVWNTISCWNIEKAIGNSMFWEMGIKNPYLYDCYTVCPSN